MISSCDIGVLNYLRMFRRILAITSFAPLFYYNLAQNSIFYGVCNTTWKVEVLHTYELHDSDHDELLKCIHFTPVRRAREHDTIFEE